MNHARDGDNRDIGAFALDVCLAQWDNILALWHLTAHSIEHLILEDHHQVIIADRSSQQSLCICRGGRDHSFNTRHVREH